MSSCGCRADDTTDAGHNRCPEVSPMTVRFGVILFVAVFSAVHRAGAAEDFPHGRLPDTVTPERYTLTLEIDPRQTGFSGQADIAVRINHAAPRIWLHGSGLTVSKAAIDVGGRTLPARYEQIDPISGAAKLDVDSSLPVGPAIIHLTYARSAERRVGK